MSYLDRCVIKEDILLRKLKPSRNLIVFVYNKDVLIPVSRIDFKRIMETKICRCNNACDTNQNFYKIPNEIYIDSSLEECYENKINTMELYLKGKFKYHGNLFDFFEVVPIRRNMIENETKERSTFIDQINDEFEEDQEDNDYWDKEDEKKKTGNYEERIKLDEKSSCFKIYVNSILVKETYNRNGNVHREKNPAKIYYYENGDKECQEWYKNGKLHSEADVPCRIFYYENGNKKAEEWYRNGKRHREADIPAQFGYYENGNKKYEIWYQNDKLNREGNLPPRIIYYKNGNKKLEQWFKNDLLNRSDSKGDLPSFISYYESGNVWEERWIEDNKWYRKSNNEIQLPTWVKYHNTANKQKKEEIWCENKLVETIVDWHIPYLVEDNKKIESIEDFNKLNHEYHCRRPGSTLPSHIYYFLGGIIWKKIWNNDHDSNKTPMYAMTFYKNGNTELEISCRDKDQIFFQKTYHKNGKISKEMWFKNLELHKKNDPAFVEYDENGFKHFQMWFEFGKPTRVSSFLSSEWEEEQFFKNDFQNQKIV